MCIDSPLVLVIDSEECAYECKQLSEADKHGIMDLPHRRNNEAADEQSTPNNDEQHRTNKLHSNPVFLPFVAVALDVRLRSAAPGRGGGLFT